MDQGQPGWQRSLREAQPRAAPLIPCSRFLPSPPGFNDLSAEEKAKLGGMLPSLFLFSVVWSLGASCDKNGRLLFDRWLRDQVAEVKGVKLAEGAMLPAGSSVYEWCYDQETAGWVTWMDTIPDFKCDPDRPFAEV